VPAGEASARLTCKRVTPEFNIRVVAGLNEGAVVERSLSIGDKQNV